MSVKKAISILAQNGICVNEEEASVILKFLYLIAKSHNKAAVALAQNIPKGKSNSQKVQLNNKGSLI